MCHAMKLWERLIRAMLRHKTSIGNTQYGFRPGKCQMVVVDLENAYDRVSREFKWWCFRKKGVHEGYVTIIQDMYNDCDDTLVSTRGGDTEKFS